MKHFVITLLLLLTCFFFNLQCAIGPVNGLIFTSNRFAGEFNPANDVKFEKEGVGCMHQFLGLVVLGSSSAGRVAQNSGITKIALIDHSTLNVFQVVYGRYCTHVYGE